MGGPSADRLRRTSGRIAAVPTTVWLVTALFGLTMLMWVHLVPYGQAPDSAGHASLVRHLSYGEAYPAYDEFWPAVGTMSAWLGNRPGIANADRGPWLIPEEAPPRAERPSFAELGGREPSAHQNQLTQHPPAYYVALAPVARLTRGVLGGQPLEREWTVWRIANVALVVPLPLLAWATARRLGAPPEAATTAAVFPLMIPQLLHIGASVNNDNLLVLLGGLLAVGLAGVARGDVRVRTAGAVGLVAGLALLTKAHAFAFLPWIPIAYAVPLVGDRSRWRVQARGAVIATVTAGVVGGWWWIRNLVRFGELSPSSLDGFVRPDPGFEPDLVDYTTSWIPTVLHRFWGNFAAYQAPISPAVVGIASVATIGMAAAAFAPSRIPGLGPVLVRRWPLGAEASLIPILGVLIFARAYSYYADTGYAAMMQGRYLFSAVVPLAVVVGAGAARVLHRGAPLAALAAATLLQVEGIRAVLHGLWAEPDASLTRSARALLAWSPTPVAVTVAHVAVVAVALVATAIALHRDRGPRPVPG